MKLKKIRFNYFRCFDDYTIEFRSGVTLLIGDNASGKTSVIRGVVLALNSFFKGFSDENTSCSGIYADDFNHSVSNESKSLTRPASVTFTTINSDTEQTILRKSMKTGTTYPNMKQFNLQNRDLYQRVADEDGVSRKTPLPLIVYFATDDIHVRVSGISEKAFKDYYLTPSFGYYYCLKGGFLSRFWVQRMIVLAEGAKGEAELNIVIEALRRALGADGCAILQDVSVRPKQGYVYFILSDGREVRFEDLSDGYLRLVNTIMDIAFRCAIMNRTVYGKATCEKTEGVVCIDEIDDHLHPSLQALVVNALRHTFPNIQFIISTHAPMIMSSVENTPKNIVYRLGYADGNYFNEVVDTYGLDASTIIKTYLNQSNKDITVQRQLDRLFHLIDDEDVEGARTLLAELEMRFADRLPEIARARTLLSFYEI